jgi:putative selenium metabolism hydrolase
VSGLDARIRELAARYQPLAAELLREAVRIPKDHPTDEGEPIVGLSNHEGPRLERLASRLVEHGCVANEADRFFDDYGNLVWRVERADDPTPRGEKTVVLMDGHCDTVRSLAAQWRAKIGEGMDAFDGLTDIDRIDTSFVEQELGYVPPRSEWEHLLFGRGAADQLGGVVCQMVATKIMLELAHIGALDGVVVWAMATVAEEDNDGGGPMFLLRSLAEAPLHHVPDVVVLTEGTGDANKGALGIYRGQRGRMQIEVEVTGRSCHGSMPAEGLNPLEYGAAILVAAERQHVSGDTFGDDAFLGRGSRTASWAKLDTPSDCAVPERFTFRFDRRLTAGEDPETARRAVEDLWPVSQARDAGLSVLVRVPRYDQPTWRGYVLGNDAIYPGWVTPEDHPAIQAAVDAYRRVVSPAIGDEEDARPGGSRRREPRVDRWIFSTDGVGYQLPADEPARKAWLTEGRYQHPPMFGFGPGIEQNTHKVGECVDTRELESVCALLARFPTIFRETR